MAKTGKRQSMGSVDKAWLEMDRETNLMIINGVMFFDGQIDYVELRETFEGRMVGHFPRFRQRVVEPSAGSGRLFWEDDPYFDIRAHLWHIALPEPGTKETLQNLVSDLMNTDLDRSKPLWWGCLIDNYDSGSALFMRCHHSIADGVSLVQVMLSMTQTADGTPLLPLGDLPPAPEQRGLVRTGGRLARRATAGSAKIAGNLIREGYQAARNPSDFIETTLPAHLQTAVATGLITAAGAAVLARLIIIPSDRASVFQGELGTAKQVLWSDPVDLVRVKEIGRATGSTVNDVLISALAGALRGFMEEEGDDVDDGDLRAMVPVNLRSSDEPLNLGNRFGMVYLSLPISVDDPLQRLFTVKQRMDLLKSSPEAVVVFQVLNLLGMLPGELAAHAVDLFATKASAVLTNVPGPQEALYFAGAPMRRMMFWVPQSGNIGLGISIISYDGQVTLGIVVDEKFVTDPQRIMVKFQSEFHALAEQVGLTPVDGTHAVSADSGT